MMELLRKLTGSNTEEAGAPAARVAPRFPDRRRRNRHTVTGEVTLLWRGPSQQTYTVAATIRDVSSEGMALFLPQPVPVGQAVQVGMQGTAYLARVRNCRPEGAGFLAGVHLMTS